MVIPPLARVLFQPAMYFAWCVCYGTYGRVVAGLLRLLLLLPTLFRLLLLEPSRRLFPTGSHCALQRARCFEWTHCAHCTRGPQLLPQYMAAVRARMRHFLTAECSSDMCFVIIIILLFRHSCLQRIHEGLRAQSALCVRARLHVCHITTTWVETRLTIDFVDDH